MSRLPVVSSDGNAWGTILNDFLSQAHNADGSIKNYYCNVKDPAFGAKGDGTTDDTTAIQTAINSLTSGGTVFFPVGVYMISAALTIPVDNITLEGVGSDFYVGTMGTVLKKSATIDLVDASGTATGFGTHRHGFRLRNMTLHGNNLTGKLLRLYYCDSMVIDSVYFYANNDMGIETAECFDSYFLNCYFLFCGDTAATVPSFYLKNSAAASGFGFSASNTNMIWFVNCHWESFIAGALWIAAGAGNTNQPNGIYLINCKMETDQCTGQPFVQMDGFSFDVKIKHLYISGNAFRAGYSTPGPAIGFYGNAGCIVDGVFASMGAAVFNCILEWWPSGGSLEIKNFSHYGTNPTVAVVKFSGTTTIPLYLDNVSSSSGTATLFSGAPPLISSKQSLVHTPAFASTYTPDILNKGNLVIISPVTGAMTINAPLLPYPGAKLQFVLTSDGTGNYALTWNAIYKAAGQPLPGAMPRANATISLAFVSDGTTWWYTAGNLAPVQSATAVAIAASGAIPTAGLDVSRLAPTAARTGITMQAGTFGGQQCFVINESAFVLTYNATPATSLIANSAVVTTLPVTSGRLFVWDSSTSLWY